MKTMVGAVAGAVAVCAVLVAYDLGEHHTFTRDIAAASMGYAQGQPYLTQAGQTGYAPPYAPYATPLAAPYQAAPYQYGVAPGMPTAGYAVPQYVNQQAVTTQPVARRVSYDRPYATERVSKPARSWQKSALLIGGSAAGSAGVGALIGGKKGAGIGALLGGGAAAIYDQIKRH